MVRYIKLIFPAVLIISVIAVLLAAFPGFADKNQKERFYVGEAACRSCHHNTGLRDQHNSWYLSKHARGYASLALPESKEIARLSGIDVNPFLSPICLKCHTTASDTEAWRRDETFLLEDGVQCEHCHGPGSDYMDQEIMADRDASREAGLIMPEKKSCLVCHKPKGSHQAVLKVKTFEYESAVKEIGHPGRVNPATWDTRAKAVSPSPGRYIGATACGRCHKGEDKGYIFSKWRLSPHADAYAVLGTPKAFDVAKKQEVKGNPQKSPTCLKCHATVYPNRAEGGADMMLGVQCESCHGPGIDYAKESIMADPAAAKKAGLIRPTAKTCKGCHKEKNFNFQAMKQKVCFFPKRQSNKQTTGQSVYKTPSNLAVSHDSKRLFIVCESSDTLIVFDTVKRKIVAEITVGNQPHGVCFSQNEKKIFVSNRGSDSVSVIDGRTYNVLTHIPVGDEPHGLTTTADDTMLYVANAGSYDISVVDLKLQREVKRLSAGRGTWDVKRSPDGKSVYVTNNLSHFIKFRTPSVSEVTVVDTADSKVKHRYMLPGTNLLQGVDFVPSGEFALVTLIRTKNLVPMTRVLQGWVLTNGIGVLWKDGRMDQLLLDENENFFADPADIVVTPDGKYAYVSGGGIDAVAVIDIRRMKEIIRRSDNKRRRDVLPNHLGLAGEYIRRIPVGRSPRGLAASPDGRYIYVADALDDTVSVIQVADQKKVAVINLGGPKTITLERKGERIFHSAAVTFGRQFSCHTCHPDGGIDAVTYDIEPDGLGFNPVDNRTLRGILDTAPFKWTGKNKSLQRQCGPRLAVFFTRIDPFTPDQVTALERYICTIPRNPNRYRKGDSLTDAQRRGKVMFNRTHANSGKPIPKAQRCNICHSGPYFTNREKVDVGTASHLDTHGVFDVPHLNNIYESAPYLHDGRADTLEEIWTRFNPYDTHGVTNDMTKDQLNDLVEYLKTL